MKIVTIITTTNNDNNNNYCCYYYYYPPREKRSSTTTTTTTVVPSQPIMLRSLHGAYLVVNASGSTSMATKNDIRHGARLQMVRH